MLYTIRDLVTLGNSYLKEKEDKNEPCNRALLKNIAMYFTQIFNILGLNSKPEEIGFSSSNSAESGGANKEEVVMPYLQALANFRENVRKEAIGNYAARLYLGGVFLIFVLILTLPLEHFCEAQKISKPFSEQTTGNLKLLSFRLLIYKIIATTLIYITFFYNR